MPNRDTSRLGVGPRGGTVPGLLLMLGVTAAGGAGGFRTRAEVAGERQTRRDRTWEEVRAIAAEFHALLPWDKADAVGAAYSRYSSRFQDSVADQVRTAGGAGRTA